MFSGIGAFAEAARSYDIQIQAAFDQNERANAAYAYNFESPVRSTNLDSIKIEQIPNVDLWWMSPPCTPYSVRGKQQDLSDKRAASFKNLIAIAKIKKPQLIMIENVNGFAQSQAKQWAVQTLSESGFANISIDLCPSMFGIPMRRPRHFVVFGKNIKELRPPTANTVSPLSSFLEDPDEELFLSTATVQRYGEGFDIVDTSDVHARAICFTKNYARCMNASGSVIKHDQRLRRFSPREILRLLGFNDTYAFPDSLSLDAQWKLVGNSVDVRAIRFLLDHVLSNQ